MKTKHHGQMSESFLTAVFLSLSGGLQDAYTYLFRGKVFANAQTGNIVLLSANIMDGRWDKVLHYLVPLCAFALGVLAAEKMREHFQVMQRLHWRQLVVLGEVLLLFLVGFLPQEQNLLANAIVSFSCAMQVQAFRKVNGYAFASTMCIGDLRSGVEAFCIWCKSHEPHAKDRMVRYFGIILLFALGAGLGSKSAAQLGGRAIWLSCCFLLVSFALMFIREELEENPVIEKDLTAIRQETREIDHALRQELQEQQQELRELLANKNYFGVEEMVEGMHLNDTLKKLFSLLGSFETQVEELAEAKSLASDYPNILSAITDLEKLGSFLRLYGIEKYVSFELGIISNYHYYTGIIFAGYTFGTGEPVVKGGRYDRLLTYFGRKAPAIGFAIVVDQLLSALSRQKITLPSEEKNQMIVYAESKIAEAVEKAKELRAQGISVSLIQMQEGRSKDDYLSYAMKDHVSKVEFIEEA